MTKPFDPTKPVQTRNGKSARILCTNRKPDRFLGDRPIIALTDHGSGEIAEYFFADGRRSLDISSADLVNIRTKYFGWVNVYGSGDPNGYRYSGDIYHTEEAANFAASSSGTSRVSCAKIEWEE